MRFLRRLGVGLVAHRQGLREIKVSLPDILVQTLEYTKLVVKPNPVIPVATTPLPVSVLASKIVSAPNAATTTSASVESPVSTLTGTNIMEAPVASVLMPSKSLLLLSFVLSERFFRCFSCSCHHSCQ